MGSIRLVDFRQGDQALDLQFEGIPILAVEARACFTTGGGVSRNPSSIDATDRGSDSSHVHLRLPGLNEEPDAAEYVVLLTMTTNGRTYDLELVRQGETFLWNAYGFERSGGYCILGHHDVDVGEPAVSAVSHPRLVAPMSARVGRALRAAQRDDVDAVIRPLIDAHPELALARRAIVWLETQSLATGPSHASRTVRRAYSLAPFGSRLWMLRRGLHRVQCSGFRDLFVELLAGQGAQVRAVDANSALPPFKDLVGYGHSLGEVFLASTGSWAIVDPWMAGLVVLDDQGCPKGVDAVRSGEALIARHLVPKLERRLSPDGRSNARSVTFLPSDIDLTRPLLNRGCRQPGYRDYFRSVRLSPVVVQRRSGRHCSTADRRGRS